MEIKWESPLKIVQYPDPRLRARNSRIGVFDERLQQLAKEMFDIMYECATTYLAGWIYLHVSFLLNALRSRSAD